MPATMMASDIPTRVIQVLQNYLPTELVLIDAQRGGEATPVPVPYLAGPRPVQDIYPSISVDVKRIRIIRADAVQSVGNVEYHALTEAAAHVQSTGQDTNRMRDLAERYAAGIFRVLLKKNGLETAVDPTRFAIDVLFDGEEIAFLDEEQSSGALVRSARVNFRVWMDEAMQ